MKVKVKICCISSIEEARLAIAYGAAAIGLVGRMPSGPGIITDELIHSIAKTVLPPIDSFLLTSETTAEAIIEHHNKVNTTTIQIVDALSGREYHKIREAIPNVQLVQVIHVLDEKAVQEAIEISEWVDAILLDSGNPNLSTKVLGGTGKTHNWDLSKKIRENISIPTYLAGGINKGNIRKAIDHMQPFGIDLCSSVRTNGQLDESKLEELFKALL
ncbi:MAG: phosphoribosylanthranilate isomerase [Burkholderiaceae bacterium]